MISGFTFIRNGVKLDYPFKESILSALPLVDEIVVNVGRSEDTTLEVVKQLAQENPKIRFFVSEWDEKMRKDGLILSQQTNLAMQECKGEWGLYLQADEVLHEEDYPKILAALEQAKKNPQVDGILFPYIHFYGDFFVVNKNPSAYRYEIRMVKLGVGITSWKDAQGFRKKINQGFEKIKVIATDARIFHYGWVRPPEVMKVKTVEMDKLYHENSGAGTGDNYLYKRIYGLERFTLSHPKVILPRVMEKRWKIDLFDLPMTFTIKDIRKVISRCIEKYTGWLPFEYKNYIRVD